MTTSAKWPARQAEMRGPGFGRVRWTILLFIFLPIPVLFFLVPHLRTTLNGTSEGDMCLVEPADVTGHAVYLLDLRKPLGPAHGSLPGKLLRDISHDLGANTELKVFALTTYAESPRMLLGGICKPYDNADLRIATAKDQSHGNGLRDCADVPAQVPVSLRDKVKQYCSQRDALQRRIDVLAEQGAEGLVANSYLVEALEDTFGDLEVLSGAKSLYVFSDMMQHASWYSHLDLRWEDWSFEDFSGLREERAALMGSPTRPGSDIQAKVFYVARAGTTENLRLRGTHQQFWQDYFADVELDFEDRAAMPGYLHEHLMDVPSKAEMAARERERVRYEREVVEQLRAKVQEEQVALESARQRLADQRQQLVDQKEQLEERERELRAQRFEEDSASSVRRRTALSADQGAG